MSATLDSTFHKKVFDIEIFNTTDSGSGVEDLYIYGQITPTLPIPETPGGPPGGPSSVSYEVVIPDFEKASLIGILKNVDTLACKAIPIVFTSTSQIDIKCAYSDSVLAPTVLPDIMDANTNGWHDDVTVTTKWVSHQLRTNHGQYEWSTPVSVSSFLPSSSFLVKDLKWKGTLASAPTSPYFNWIYQNESNNIIYRYDETEAAWIPLILDTDAYSEVVKSYLPDRSEEELLRDKNGNSEGSSNYLGEPLHGPYNRYIFKFSNYLSGYYYYLWVRAKDKQGNFELLLQDGPNSQYEPLITTDKLIDSEAPEFNSTESIGTLYYDSDYFCIDDPAFLPEYNKNQTTLNDWAGSRRILSFIDNSTAAQDTRYINSVVWDNTLSRAKFQLNDQSGLGASLTSCVITDITEATAGVGQIKLSIPQCDDTNLAGFLIYRRNLTSLTSATTPTNKTYNFIKYTFSDEYVNNNLTFDRDDLAVANNQKFQYKIYPVSKYTIDSNPLNSDFSNAIVGTPSYNGVIGYSSDVKTINKVDLYYPVSGTKPSSIILKNQTTNNASEWYISTYNNGNIKLRWCKTTDDVTTGKQLFSQLDVNNDIKGFILERAREQKIGTGSWELGAWELLSQSDYNAYPSSDSGTFEFSYLDTGLESYNTNAEIDTSSATIKLVRYQYRIKAFDYGGNTGDWSYFNEPTRSIQSTDSVPPDTTKYDLKVDGKLGALALEFKDNSYSYPTSPIADTVEIEIRRRRVTSSTNLAVIPVDGNNINTIGRYTVDSLGTVKLTDSKPPSSASWWAQYQVIGRDKNGNWTVPYPTNWTTAVSSLTLENAADAWSPKPPTSVTAIYDKINGVVNLHWTLPTEEQVVDISSIDTVSGTTITSTGYAWVVDSLIGKTVRIVSGTGAGTTGVISSNTANTITVVTWSSTSPNTSSEFEVYAPLTDLDGISITKKLIGYAEDPNDLTISNVTGNIVTFTGHTFTVNELQNDYIKVSEGANKGTIAKIVSNTDITLTVAEWIGDPPGQYDVINVITDITFNGSIQNVGDTNSSSVTIFKDTNVTLGLWQYYITAYDLSGNESTQVSSTYLALVSDFIPPMAPVIQNVIGGIGTLTLTWSNTNNEQVSYYKVYVQDKNNKTIFNSDGFFNSSTRSQVGDAIYVESYSNTLQIFNVSDTKYDVSRYSIKVIAVDESNNESTNLDYIEVCTTFDTNGLPIEDAITSYANDNNIVIKDKIGTTIPNNNLTTTPEAYYCKIFLDSYYASDKTRSFNVDIPAADVNANEYGYTDNAGNVFLKVGTGNNLFDYRISKVAIYRKIKTPGGSYGPYVFLGVETVVNDTINNNHGVYYSDLNIGNYVVTYRIHPISASNIMDITGNETDEILAVDSTGFDLDHSHDDFTYSFFDGMVYGKLYKEPGKVRFLIPDVLDKDYASYFEVYRSPFQYYNSTASAHWDVNNFYNSTRDPNTHLLTIGKKSDGGDAWERVATFASTPGSDSADYFVFEDNDWSPDGDIEDSKLTKFSAAEYQNHAIYAIVATDKWGNRGKPYFVGGVNGTAVTTAPNDSAWLQMPAVFKKYYIEIVTPYYEIKYDANNTLVAPTSAFTMSAKVVYGNETVSLATPYFKWEYNDTPDLSGSWIAVPGQGISDVNNNETITVTPSNFNSINVRTYRLSLYKSYADYIATASILATDTQGIFKLQNGEANIYPMLDTYSTLVQANENGTTKSNALDNVKNKIKVYRGFTDITSNFTITVAHDGGANASVSLLSGTEYKVNTMNVNSLVVTFTATSGSTVFTQKWTVTKLNDGASAVNYYIKPLNGTAIKNGVGSLSFEAHKITGNSDSLLGAVSSSQPIQLYLSGTSKGVTTTLTAADITNYGTLELVGTVVVESAPRCNEWTEYGQTSAYIPSTTNSLTNGTYITLVKHPFVLEIGKSYTLKLVGTNNFSTSTFGNVNIGPSMFSNLYGSFPTGSFDLLFSFVATTDELWFVLPYAGTISFTTFELSAPKIYDTISIIDITDKQGFVGQVDTPHGLVLNVDKNNVQTPSVLTLEPKFYFDGEQVTPTTITRSTPGTLPGGVTLNGNIITVSSSWLGSSLTFTWTGTYYKVLGGRDSVNTTKYEFTVTETIYKVKAGKDANSVTAVAQGIRTYSGTNYPWDFNFSYPTSNLVGTYFIKPLIYLNGGSVNDPFSHFTITTTVISGTSANFDIDPTTHEVEVLSLTGLAPNNTIKWDITYTDPYTSVITSTVLLATVKYTKDGIGVFKSTAFIRINKDTMSVPTGGTYNSPIPTSGVLDPDNGSVTVPWSDGIPSGFAKLWSTTRIFTENGLSPQQSVWSAPVVVASSKSRNYLFTDYPTDPGLPAYGGRGPNPGVTWIPYGNTNSVWMAYQDNIDGAVTDWTVIKIKGEQGEKGEDSYTVLLSNENHTVQVNPGGEVKSGQIGSTGLAKTSIIVKKGADTVPITSGYTISGSFNTQLYNGWTFDKSGADVYVKTLIPLANQSVVFPISINIVGGPTIVKEWSIDKRSSGIVNLVASTQVLKYYANNSIYDGSNINLVFTATPIGVTNPTYKFYRSTDDNTSYTLIANGGGYTISNNVLTIDKTLFGSLFDESLRIKVEVYESGATSFSDFDITTVVKIQDALAGTPGSNAVAVKLTASSYVVSYDVGGLNANPHNISLTTAVTNPPDGMSLYYTFTKISGPGSVITIPGNPTAAYSENSTYIDGNTVSQIKVDVYENDDGYPVGPILATDQISIFSIKKAENGKDAVVGFLTNENHTVVAESDGTGYNLDSPDAGGLFKVFSGLTDVTNSCSFEIVGGTLEAGPQSSQNSVKTQNGLMCLTPVGSPYIPNGAYILVDNPAWEGSDLETFTLRATYQTAVIDKTYTITRVKKGQTGPSGYNTAIVYIYKRTLDQTALPTVVCRYTFSTKTLTNLNGGWSTVQPANNGLPLYVSAATASSVDTYDDIATGEWTPATILSQDFNTASVYIYQRATSAPAKPTGDLIYVFSTKILSGATLGSWSQTIPSGTNPLYVTTATAFSNTPQDTISTGEWATVTKMAQDGISAVYGYITSASPLSWVRSTDQITWTPTSTTLNLNCTFRQNSSDVARYGALVTRTSSGSLSAVASSNNETGNLEIARISVTVVSQSSQSITVKFTYNWDGIITSVSETVTTILSGNVGVNAKSVKLEPSRNVVRYDDNGTSILDSPTAISFNAYPQNISLAQYEFILDNLVVKSKSTSSIYSFDPSDYASFNNTSKIFYVKVYENGTTLVATDSVSVIAVKNSIDGKDAIVGVLSNENHTVPASSVGAVLSSDLNSAGGIFQVYEGATRIVPNEGLGFEIIGGANNGIYHSKTVDGLTLSIDKSTGEYILTQTTWSNPSLIATFTLKARYGIVGGTAPLSYVEKVYTITKSKAGVNAPSIQVKYNSVSTGDISTWSSTFRSTDKWMRISTNGGTSNTDFGSPTQIVGENGKDAYHVFKRAISKPAVPTGLDGNNPGGGWTDGPPPDNGQPLWMSKGDYDPVMDEVTSWSTPIQLDGDSSRKPEDTDLRLFYDFNDFKLKTDNTYSGNKLYDKSNNKKDAIINSKIVSSNSATGYSLKFIDNINIITTPLSDYNISDSFSFGIGFKIENISSIETIRGILSAGITGVNGFKIGVLPDYTVKVYSSDNGGGIDDFIISSPTYIDENDAIQTFIKDNTWHTVVVIYNNGECSLIIDDKLHATKNINIINSDLSYNIGDPIYNPAVQTTSGYKYVYQRSLNAPLAPVGDNPELDVSTGWKSYIPAFDTSTNYPVWYSRILYDNLLDPSRVNTNLSLFLDINEGSGNIINDVSYNGTSFIIESSYLDSDSGTGGGTVTGQWSAPAVSMQPLEISEFKVWSRTLDISEAKGVYTQIGASSSPSVGGEQIKFGKIQSNNWTYTSDKIFTGSSFDLDLGKLYTSNGIFKGSISASSGDVGGWIVEDARLTKTTGNYSIGLYSGENPRFELAYGNGDGEFIELGKITNGLDAGKFGLSYYDSYLEKTYFTLTNERKEIAGWGFTDSSLIGSSSKGTKIATAAAGTRIELDSTDHSLKYFFGTNPSNVFSLKANITDSYMSLTGGIGLLIGNNKTSGNFVGLGHFDALNETSITMSNGVGSYYSSVLSQTKLRNNLEFDGFIETVINSTIRSKLSGTGLEITGSIKASGGYKTSTNVPGGTDNITLPDGRIIVYKDGLYIQTLTN